MMPYSSLQSTKERGDALSFMDAIGLRHILNSIKKADICFSNEPSVEALFDVPNDVLFDLADLPHLSRTSIRRHAPCCLDHRLLRTLDWALRNNHLQNCLSLAEVLLRAPTVQFVEFPDASVSWLEPIYKRWSRKALMVSLSGGHDLANSLYLEHGIAFAHALALVHALPQNSIARNYLSYIQRRYTGVMSNPNRMSVQGHDPSTLRGVFYKFSYREQLELLMTYGIDSNIGQNPPTEIA